MYSQAPKVCFPPTLWLQCLSSSHALVTSTTGSLPALASSGPASTLTNSLLLPYSHPAVLLPPSCPWSRGLKRKHLPGGGQGNRKEGKGEENTAKVWEWGEGHLVGRGGVGAQGRQSSKEDAVRPCGPQKLSWEEREWREGVQMPRGWVQRTGRRAAQAETMTLVCIRKAHTTHPPNGTSPHSRPQQFSSVQFSRSVVSNYLGPHGLQNGEGSGTPLQYSCLENPMDRGAW